MIPKVIYLTYKHKDPNLFPERCKKCYKSIESCFLLAGYTIEISDDDDMDQMVRSFDSKLFDLYKKQPIIVRTDIWRLVVLYTKGGFYMDTDVLWERSPIPLFQSCKSQAILCQEKTTSPHFLNCQRHKKLWSISNYFMACVKGHWFFRSSLNNYF